MPNCPPRKRQNVGDITISNVYIVIIVTIVTRLLNIVSDVPYNHRRTTEDNNILLIKTVQNSSMVGEMGSNCASLTATDWAYRYSFYARPLINHDHQY